MLVDIIVQSADAGNVFIEAFSSVCVCVCLKDEEDFVTKRTRVLALRVCLCVLFSVILTVSSRDLSCIPNAGAPSASPQRLKHTAWRQCYKGQHAL